MLVLAAMLILLALVAVFASQNTAAVTVAFLGWKFEWPLAGVVLITLVVGALLVFLVGVYRQIRLRLQMRDTSGKLRKSETELGTAKTELDKTKAELEKTKAELERAKRELEEARGQAGAPGGTANGAGGPGGGQPNGSGQAKGGGPGGRGLRRG